MPELDDNKNNEFLGGLRATPAEPQKLIRVHRCNSTTTKSATDYRCGCDEYISQTEANLLLQSGDAERLTVDRVGKPYVRRDSIVIWQTPEQLEKIAAKREEKYKAAGRQKVVAKILKDFRAKLTKAENKNWSDEVIVQALEAGVFPVDGVGIKQKLLDASNEELAAQSNFVREMATTSRIYAAFYKAALAYWDKVRLVYDEGLSIDKGQYMTDADQGKGLLVSGGYGVDKIAQIDGVRSVQREMFRSPGDDGELDKGCRKRTAATFVPGSGGSEMNVDGEVVDAESMYNVGKDPIRCEEGDEDKARRIREKWLKDQFDKPEPE